MEPTAFRRATVLAVDDQQANLVTLDAVLGTDFDLVRAHSGIEALAILEKRQDIDVILMDVQMPAMDGFETASRIKRMEGCRDIPIIFVTAVYNEDPFVKQGYKVGAVDYFSKPFDPEILRVKVGIYASFRQKEKVLKERARQVRESEELLRVGRRLSATFERPRVGVVVTDTEGRMLHANREALEDRDTIARWWGAEGELATAIPGFLARALAGDRDSQDLRAAGAGNSETLSIVCTAAPIHDPDGKLAGAVVLIHDMTERKRMSRELETRITRLASPEPDPVAG